MNTIRLTIQGNFAHYKRLDGASVKQTHTIPTRTSIFGLIGAILGRPRDSYYSEFGEKFEISIVPKHIRRYSIPQLEVSTASTPQIGKTGIKAPKHRKNRQRTSIEYLVDPEFDIYIRSDSFPDELIERLSNHQYKYSPYMGTTECLADIQFHGFVEISQNEITEVHSVIPESDVQNVTADNGDTITFERMASNFTTNNHGRNAEGYFSVVVNLKGKSTLSIQPTESTEVYTDESTNQNLMFF